MILFRLVSFFARVFFAFLFVFISQIQFNGKTLESYLSDWSSEMFITKTLNQTGEDGALFIKSFTDSDSKINNEKFRKLSSQLQPHIQDIKGKVQLPRKKDQ